MDNPKLFISYSWSNQEHESRVIQLATELRESGVDAILDKWDLKEGHDAIAFMEKMVNDPEIKKVVMVCDKTYSEKANGRTGGVGTETQIISKEVYEKQDQSKFVAVIMEKDEQGKPCLPTYYKTRIYIDLSEPEKYSQNFEQLLRWIFDKPLYVKPEIGKTPTFIDENAVTFNNSASHSRLIDAIRNNKSYAAGTLEDYLAKFSEDMEKLRITGHKGEFDDAVVANIEDFLPFRNQLIQLFFTISRYSPNEEYIQKLHRFFESLIPYMFRPKNVSQSYEWDYDNFKFIIHELFLYLMGILVEQERFELANYFMEQPYYVPGNLDYGNESITDFNVFRQYMKSLEYRNNRLQLRRLSLRADLLNKRSTGTGLDFMDLMQADFILFMRSSLGADGRYWSWWPETLVYLGPFQKQFEIFARSVSRKYFDKIKCLLAIDVPKDLEQLLKDFKEDKKRLPRWECESIYVPTLLGYEKLATKS